MLTTARSDVLEKASMKTVRCRISFLTPAFLGDAEQNARWRTPPFKAQLRQWWRMVWAADHKFYVNLEGMLRQEGFLFGNAWLENEFRKSLVRLRLDRWREGTLKKEQWPTDTLVTHPEVKNKEGQIKPIGSALYLGYGPLEFKSGTKLKKNAAIQAGESADFSLAFPTSHHDAGLKVVIEANVSRIERALWLMHLYGTVGGRSRNGWGSYDLRLREGDNWGNGKASPLRDWKQCLDLDWPHAIGKDEKGPLIWRTQPHDDWKSLMKTLAIIKIGLRTQFKLTLDQKAGDEEIKDKKTGNKDGINHGKPQSRHWLGYPLTKHPVQPWDHETVNGKKRSLNLRLPNQLRFKVRATDDRKLVGVIFHVPHLPPPAFNPNRTAIEGVWQKVHTFLDAPAQKLTRIAE